MNNDERRDRYAHVIREWLRFYVPGSEVEEATHDVTGMVVAVSDAERHTERVAMCKYIDALDKMHDAEIARLRAEVVRERDMRVRQEQRAARLDASLDVHGEAVDELVREIRSLRQQRDELRDELERVQQEAAIGD